MDGMEEMIANLKKLGTLEARTAELAAPLLEAASKAQIAKGEAPDGKTWAPKKDNRGRPLANAAQAMHAEAAGPVVTLVIEGPEYWHQVAKPDGGLPQRKMIPGPGDPVPPHLQEALDKASAQAFAEITGGKR